MVSCVGQLFFLGWEAMVGKGLRVAIDKEWGYLSSTVISYCAVVTGKGGKKRILQSTQESDSSQFTPSWVSKYRKFITL